MRFVVGLDLAARSEGAIRFARWLHARGGGAHTIAGVHVLEQIEDSLAVKLSVSSVSEVKHYAERALAETLLEADAKNAFAETAVTSGASAESALANLGRGSRADAIIVGQNETRTLPRLGRVTRRLLRSLPVPVAVVPPALRSHDLPQGPVLVATDLQPHSVFAVRNAITLAESVDRTVRLVHVAPEHGEVMPAFVPRTFDPGVRASYQEGVRQRVTAWRVESDLPELDAEVEFGSTVERILGTAQRVGAPFIVCGSRRLSLTDRIFQTSTGSRLAAKAGCPVFVVPPGE